MLEQEIASIIKFTLDGAGNPSPYYYNVPEDFTVPAAYFPSPEISTRGETFRTYAMEYAWYIKFFHKTNAEAHELALAVLTAIKQARNLVPLIGASGNPTGRKLRLDDPEISYTTRGQSVDESGAAILKLYWTSRRPYTDAEVLKMQEYHIEDWEHPDIYLQKTVEAAYETAVVRCVNDFPNVEKAGQFPVQP